MFRKVVLTGIAFIAFGLTKFVFNTLVIRLFPATFLGEVNQALSLFLLVPLLYAPALGTMVSKFASEFLGSNEPRKSRQVFSLSFLIVAGMSVVGTVFVLTFFSALSGSLKVQPAVMAGLAPMLVLYSLYAFLKTSYYGFDRVPLYLRNEIVSSAVFFAVLAAAAVTRSQWLVVLPFASHGVVFTATAIYHLHDQFRFRDMFADITEDLRRCTHFVIHIMIISLTGPGAFHLGIILTGRLTGNLEIAAYYSVLLYSLQPLNLVPISLVSVMIPTISRYHGAGRIRDGVAVAERAFLPLFLVMTLFWGGGVILGREAVRAIAGMAPRDMILAFEVVLFALYAMMIAGPPIVLLNATRHIAVIAWSGVVAALAAIVTWEAAIPAYGLLGSAAGYAVLQIGKAVWGVAAARHIYQWRSGLGWSAKGTVAAVLVLGALSLTCDSALLHLILAVVFAGLFLILHARSLREYGARVLSELRPLASGAAGISDDVA